MKPCIIVFCLLCMIYGQFVAVTCLMNFEKALYDLLVSIFPYSEIVVCVFHLGQ